MANFGGAAFPCVCGGGLFCLNAVFTGGVVCCGVSALLIAASILSRCATRDSDRVMLCTISIVLSDVHLSF